MIAEKIAALRILVALFPTAYFLSPDLWMFTAFKIVNYSLRHGISPLSAVGFVRLRRGARRGHGRPQARLRVWSLGP